MKGAFIGAILGAVLGLLASIVMVAPGTEPPDSLPEVRAGLWSLLTLNGSFPAGVWVFPIGLGLILGWLGSRRGKPHF